MTAPIGPRFPASTLLGVERSLATAPAAARTVVPADRFDSGGHDAPPVRKEVTLPRGIRALPTVSPHALPSLDEVKAPLTTVLSELDLSIHGAESLNREKRKKISLLIRGLETRKAELRETRRPRRRPGVFSGVLASVGAVEEHSVEKLLEEDPMVRDLARELSDTESILGVLEQRLERYRTLRARAEAQLGSLKSTEDKLVDVDANAPEEVKTFLQLSASMQRASSLVADLEGQLEALGETRSGAGELAPYFDEAIASMQSVKGRAERAHAQARADLEKLITALVETLSRAGVDSTHAATMDRLFSAAGKTAA